jgi:lysozyme family protein
VTFEKAVEHILAFEGGYVFDSSDPGGETNFGISKRAYPHLDIKGLSREAATEIYRKDYWEPLKPMLLPARLRLCVFDCAVNQGLARAIKTLQGAVGSKQDGVLGPETYHAAERAEVAEALLNMLQLRLSHYSKLPHFARFGSGWTKRLLSVAVESLRYV